MKSIEEVLSSYSNERPNNFYCCIMIRDDSDLLHIVSYPYIMCGEVCKVVAVKRGTTKPVTTEGSFYQTRNKYQVLVYYKGVGDRTDRLLGYGEVMVKVES